MITITTTVKKLCAKFQQNLKNSADNFSFSENTVEPPKIQLINQHC